jgi:predicted metalloendopeptidase
MQQRARTERGLLLFLTLLPACTATGSAPQREATPGSGLVLTDMDLAADPAQDFYRYVNGGWLAANPVPADESSWGVFQEVDRRNELVLQRILEGAAKEPADELHRMLGDFYATGMDERAIEAQGARPLEEELARIDALAHIDGLPALLARLHAIGTDALFALGSNADLTDATTNILFVLQGGMGLPEKDYYLRDDPESVELQKEYQAHVARMLALCEVSQAEEQAAAVVELETELARAAFGAVDFRDPQRLLGKMDVAAVAALTPHFDWTAYLTLHGLDPAHPINLIAPGYFENLDALLAARPLASWKAYLRWQLVHAGAAYLSPAFEQEDFAFFGRTLGGAQEQRPRWKRVLDATGASMGEALGQAFVHESFSPRAKERCQQMVDDLLAAMRGRIEAAAWMSDETRARALEKLAAFRTKIGYPEKWRDWSGLRLQRDSYAANRLRAAEFQFRYDLAKVGRPVDKSEWGMPAYLVNAGYNPMNNDITFPAGILQPPFFGEDYDDALNYGAMGAVIGHEITHGFDDEGNQFDAAGNLANWWNAEDRAEFERRAAVVERQFSEYVAIDDLHVNGKLTLGENLADLGGLAIAWDALQRAQANQRLAPIDGFTPAQRFFIAWARAWRCNYTPELLKLLVNTNPHSPARFRAVGPLSNLDAFQEAFELPDDAPVLRAREERAHVW